MGRGQAPNPSSRRQTGNQAHTWLDLPAGGYTGPIPKWPLDEAATPEEKAAWKYLWRTPQAAAWARDELERVVARYVRVLVLAERPQPNHTHLAEARQNEDRLGLNPQAMLRNRWRVKTDETAERRTPVKESTSKRRLTVTDDADVG